MPWQLWEPTGKGLAQCNLEILEAIGNHVSGHGRPFICGADFNMSPDLMASVDFASSLSAQIVHPDVKVGTCFQGSVPSTIDYFVVSNDLAMGLKTVGVDMEALTSPHRRAVLLFHPCLTSLKVLSFRRPPPLPAQSPVGCKPPPPDWSQAAHSAEAALRAAKTSDVVVPRCHGALAALGARVGEEEAFYGAWFCALVA